MKILKLTHLDTAKTPFYVVIDNIVGFRRVGSQTHMFVSGAGADGNAGHLSVRETPEEILALMDA